MYFAFFVFNAEHVGFMGKFSQVLDALICSNLKLISVLVKTPHFFPQTISREITDLQNPATRATESPHPTGFWWIHEPGHKLWAFDSPGSLSLTQSLVKGFVVMLMAIFRLSNLGCILFVWWSWGTWCLIRIPSSQWTIGFCILSRNAVALILAAQTNLRNCSWIKLSTSLFESH